MYTHHWLIKLRNIIILILYLIIVYSLTDGDMAMIKIIKIIKMFSKCIIISTMGNMSILNEMQYIR